MHLFKPVIMKRSLFILPVLVLLFVHSSAQNYSRKYNEAENLIEWPEVFDPQNSDFYVHNEIEINASPEVVWKLLVEAHLWHRWYFGITNMRFETPGQGNLESNTKVFWESMGQRLNNTVTVCLPNRSLAWQFNETMIQGCHAWVIVPTENGCKVITDESQTGKLAKLQKLFLPRKLMKQHDTWLRDLKRQAELLQT